ncbi:MAG: sensor histidine kinase, Cache 1, partial [Gemmatimonadetes bacterium]|nr:sensor histidine kinase, Cache 1 [Gemmatimonadota bacterium]
MNQRQAHPTGSRRLLAALLDSSDDAIISMTLDGTIMVWSRGAESVYGHTAQEAIGESMALIVPLEGCGELESILARIARGERAELHQAERVRRDGSRRMTSVSLSPIVDANGVVIGAAEIARDVTEHHQLEQALRTSEAQVRLLLDSAAEGIYGVDVEGKCTLCNRTAARMLGFAHAEELIGEPMHALVHHSRADGSAYPEVECGVHRAAATGEAVHVSREMLWRADGSSFPAEYWAYPIRNDGAIVGAVVTFLDTTDRERARAALEESESRYRTLAENSFDAIGVSVNGVLHDANRAFERTFGVRRNHALGRPIIDVVADESIPEVTRRVAGSIEGSYEFIGRHASGRKLVIEATAKNLMLDGQEARFVALRDITERRRLEERVRQIQKMEALGALAGGVAHDFNNNLTVISSFTELLLSELDVADPRALDLREVRKAVDSATSLTRQLLAFSRQQIVQPRLVALETEVQRAIPLLRRVIGEDLVITTDFADTPTVVLIDAGQLEQVFMNLCINARDAMPTGGTLTVQTGRVTFDEEYSEDHWPIAVGSYAMLAISDTGVGMDAPTRARIFEPFFTTKEAGKGTGLGLATVYGIVKQNAGFIWVYSEPGLGSAFKVYFPLRGEPSAIPEVPPPVRAPMGTETILLVEDAQSVRSAAQAALRRFGYTVIAVSSAREALPWLDAFDSHIDLLVTDVVMPDMSGRELAVHATAQRPHLKVLYI